MSRIIVKNLPDKITKEKLLQIFSEKGNITDVQLKYTKEGKFRKFAFIGFQKPESAAAAKESLDKSFINTSKIQVEICAELGDPNKPRAWSKYASENVLKKRKFEEKNENTDEIIKVKKNNKEKIKDPQVVDLLKNLKNDPMFTEYLEVNASEIPKINSEEKSEEKDSENEEKENDDDDDDEEDEDKRENILANKDISDSEYIKLKTGTNINIKTETGELNEKDSFAEQKNGKALKLFTVKLNGLPVNVKKCEIKEFLKPLKAFTIRRALKIKGIAYCGFKTEKELKMCLMKNRSFIRNKRIFVTKVKEKESVDNEKITKWQNESERLKKIESVAESGRIFVRNLPYTASEDNLKQLFEKYGPLVEFFLPIDSFTRKPKGYAFVTFLIPENACKAFNDLDGSIFEGRMLHLIPGLPNKAAAEEDEENLDFKEKKLKKEKAKSGSNINWNTFFVGENALAESMAATYNTSKENVLDDKQGGTAVRLALGETQLVNKMKEFLEENDVCLESFENMSDCRRSKTVILVKNLPFGTKSEEIREKFCKFGQLKRIILPPTGVAALVEFIEPSEAKIAFRRVAYSKFKHVPMYLEWAPEKVFGKDQKSDSKNEDKVENNKPEQENKLAEEKTQAIVPLEHIPVEGATIFVKNLNFVTDDKALRKHFESCGTVVSATVARKKDPNQPGKNLSMGYGFVEFSSKDFADNALKKLQFSNLDNHKIELKRSNRTVTGETMAGRRITKGHGKPNSKILVRNIPFQANQKEVADLFKVFGEIKAVRLPKKMVGTGSHRGFCFVEYNSVNDAKRAFQALSQSTHLYGRRLVLEWAETDDNVATLREKTAQQFTTEPSRASEKKKNITIEEKVEDDEE